MKLGSFNSRTNYYECLRVLTPQEVEKHVDFLPSLTEARDRLALFGMQVVPEYMNVIVGHPATTKGEIAQHDAVALNDAPMNSSQNRVQKKLNKLVDWSV